jgi:hypothetical protein
LTSSIDPQGPRLRPGTKTKTDNYHSTCPQTKHMNAQKARSDRKFSVPVKNRFSVLGN